MNLRLDSGKFLRIDKGNDFARYRGVFSIPGVLEYDGVKELIPDEELFSPETIHSFFGVPISVEHPDQAISTENYKNHIVGSVISAEKMNGALQGEFVVYDSETIRLIDEGELTGLSIARLAELIPVIAPDYQIKQTKIRANHLALTKSPRNSKATITQRIDSKGENLMKYKCDSDGKEYEVPDSVLKDIDVQKAKIKELQEELSKKPTENQVTHPEIETLKKSIADKETILQTKEAELKAWQEKYAETQNKIPELVSAMAQEKTEVVESAKAILGDSIDFKELSIDQIKDKVIEKVLPYKASLKVDSITKELRDAHWFASLKLESKKASENPVRHDSKSVNLSDLKSKRLNLYKE
jgi:uncharacterized protein